MRDEAAYEARFGGLLYCFLRAMGRGEEGSGVVFERPAWEDVRAWERELRESRTPFGYVIDPRGARPGRGGIPARGLHLLIPLRVTDAK